MSWCTDGSRTVGAYLLWRKCVSSSWRVAAFLSLLLLACASCSDHGPTSEAKTVLGDVEFGQEYEIDSAERYSDGENGFVLLFDEPLRGADVEFPPGYTYRASAPPEAPRQRDPLAVSLSGPAPAGDGRCNLSMLELPADSPTLEFYGDHTVVEVLVHCST